MCAFGIIVKVNEKSARIFLVFVEDMLAWRHLGIA